MSNTQSNTHLHDAAEPFEVRRLREVTSELRVLDLQLAEKDGEIDRFKRAHMVAVNGQLCFRLAEITGRAALEETLSRLFRERRIIGTQRDKALAEYASLKNS